MPAKTIQDTDNVLMTAGDVAKEGEVGPGAVRNWCDTGLLPSVRTASGVRLIRRTDVLAFLAARKRRRQRVA